MINLIISIYLLSFFQQDMILWSLLQCRSMKFLLSLHQKSVRSLRYCVKPFHAFKAFILQNHVHFSIFTATLVMRLGLFLSSPMASPITTWPKQPSPRGFPSTSLLQTKTISQNDVQLTQLQKKRSKVSSDLG